MELAASVGTMHQVAQSFAVSSVSSRAMQPWLESSVYAITLERPPVMERCQTRMQSKHRHAPG